MSTDEQEILVRGSEEHKYYLKHRYGRTLDGVNSFEARLAIAGRPLLFFYVAYITVRASVSHALPTNIPALTYGLLGLDALMLLLQVMGLEGSMPGLLHLADEMDEKGKKKEANSMRRSSKVVQWLLGATAVDIVLQGTPFIANVDIRGFTTVYTNVLLITRVVAVGMYLVAMAKLSHRGPKVISPHEAARQKEEAEQKQIRIDNANVMAAVEKGVSTWAKPMVEAVKIGLQGQMQQLLAQYSEDRTALKAQMDAVQMASGSSLSLAEIGRQSEELEQKLMSQIDAKLCASTIDVDALTYDVLRQVRASMPASENTSPVDYGKLTHLISEKVDVLQQDLMRQVDAKFDALRGTSTPTRQPVAKQPTKTTLIGSTGDTDKIVAINGMTKAAFFAAFDENPELLSLSSYKLADAYNSRNATEPTARRAKNEYLETHPELKAMAM